MPLSADTYNMRARERGDFTIADVSELVRFFQTERGLLVDGKLGPQTLRALEQWNPALELELEGFRFDPQDDVGAYLMLKTLELNCAEYGQGETDGNNRGERIDFYRSTDGTGIGPGGSGSWCATLQSSSLTRAGELGGVKLPCRTSRSAKRLGDHVGHAGRYLTEPEIGCFVVWHRGSNPAQGHIGQAIHYDPATDTLTTVEGNKGPKSVVGEYTYPAGEWRDRLYCLSTLALPPGL